ncbi:hypothetical protein GGR58DRAFT_88229 [Xylaria digitata]|nr:hypothetical protein GGR58DRAFT_88229 [Xylaria digitata]
MCLVVVIIVVATGLLLFFSLSGSLFPLSSSYLSSSPSLRSRICLASTADSYSWVFGACLLDFLLLHQLPPLPANSISGCLTACAAVCGSAPRVISTAYLELLSCILGELLQSVGTAPNRFALLDKRPRTERRHLLSSLHNSNSSVVEDRELHHRTSATLFSLLSQFRI